MKSIPFDEEEEKAIILYDNDKGYGNNSYPLAKPIETILDNSIFRFIQHKNRRFFVITDIFTKTGTKHPASNASRFYNNHKDDLPESFQRFTIPTPGGKQEVLTCTFDVVCIICGRSNNKMAFHFLQTLGEFLQNIFEGEKQLVSPQETVNLYLNEQRFRTTLIEKDLDQIKSAVRIVPEIKKGLEDLALLLQSQIDSQNKIPERSSIGSKERKNIKHIIRNIADTKGVHFNTVCNEFKQAFLLRIYSDLSPTHYHNAIAWFNARHDRVKKENTVVRKGSNLDNWFNPEKKGIGGL